MSVVLLVAFLLWAVLLRLSVAFPSWAVLLRVPSTASCLARIPSMTV